MKNRFFITDRVLGVLLLLDGVLLSSRVMHHLAHISSTDVLGSELPLLGLVAMTAVSVLSLLLGARLLHTSDYEGGI